MSLIQYIDHEKIKRILIILLVSLLALIIPLAIFFLNATAIKFLAGFFILLLLLLLSFINPFWGLILCFVLISIMPLLNRLVSTQIPYGVLRDLMLLTVLLSITINSGSRIKREYAFYKNPITILLLIRFAYLILQFFNPEGTVLGWIYYVRSTLGFLVLYYIMYYFMNEKRYLKLFTYSWLALSVVIAIYSYYQELVGLPFYDYDWITSDPHRMGLYFIGGKMRKWSLLEDPAIFGMLMAFCAIYCFIMSLRARKSNIRFFYIICTILFIPAISFSGIRTAYVVFFVGIVFYFLTNLESKKHLVTGLISLIIFAAIIYGPFNSPTINSIRGAFFPGADASMQVREENREKIRGYYLTHPMGGGLSTTGQTGDKFSPGHYLAGFPPDSTYLETLLEQGFIGLFLFMFTFFFVLKSGISKYYLMEKSFRKDQLIALSAAFFALTVGMYTKKGVFNIPIGFIVMGYYALVARLLNEKLNKNN